MDCLYLVRNGVPFDLAFSLNETDRTSYIIAFGILDGREFDWDQMTWK